MFRCTPCILRHLRLLLTWTAFGVLAAPSVRAATAKNKFFPCGTEETLWLAIGESSPQEKGYKNWLACVDKRSTDVRSSGGPLDQTSQVVRAAATNNDLHIFYADGTHFRYTTHSSRRELRLPDAAMPEAIAGDATGSTSDIWAVVKTPTAEAVAVEWQKLQRLRAAESEPAGSASSAPATQPVMGALSAKGYHVVHYTGADWQPDFAAPMIPSESERIWFTIDEGQFHFFWQHTRLDAKISYALYVKGQWTKGPSITLDRAPREVSVGIGNRHVALIAMLPERIDGPSRPVVYKRTSRSTEPHESKWIESSPLTTMDGKPLSLPADSAATVFGDQIAAVRPGVEGPELGFYSLGGGAPDQNFRPVPLQRTVTNPDSRGTKDLRTGMALAALLLLVLWRRHTTFAAPASLPSGLELAGLGRRAVAAMLDILPAVLIVSVFWAEDFRKATEGLTPSSDSAQMEAAAQMLFVPSLVLRVIYIVYCAGFELVWSRTPGKWLMGCAVISEALTPANWIQIVVRNLTRLVELEPFLPISLPLLLLVVFTRNRQRVGDLLAHTLVVQRGVNPAGDSPVNPTQE